jgi:hypothetical protein
LKDNPAEMAVQAQRCRRLAKSSSGSTRNSLLLMATDYDAREKAARDDAATDPPIRPGQPKAE